MQWAERAKVHCCSLDTVARLAVGWLLVTFASAADAFVTLVLPIVSGSSRKRCHPLSIYVHPDRSPGRLSTSGTGEGLVLPSGTDSDKLLSGAGRRHITGGGGGDVSIYGQRLVSTLLLARGEWH
jgi:hypothetical protein